MKKFDKDKYLKKLKLKRKWRSYSRYVYIAVPCVLCCLLCLYFAYSKFFVSEEQAVIRTTVGDFIYGDVVINAYIDGEYSSTIPGKNDGYVVDKVSCDNGAVGEWNNNDWGLLTTNLTKRTKCNVYFKKLVSKVPDIISQLDTSGKCPTVNDDGSVKVTRVETTNGYLCKAKDAYGDSYYYRGNVTNNYVKFADKYWRIVRINGDGTVRVIYDGTSAHANGEASEDRQIGNSVFNDDRDDNASVGYMYGLTREEEINYTGATYVDVQSNIRDSVIKQYVDSWYNKKIVGKDYAQYIADNLFCNDRRILFGTGVGYVSTGYRWYNFDGNSSDYDMLLTCSQQNDAFTVADIENGNGALTYPVGLITADEVALAGGWSTGNKNYFLYSGQNYWTSSPFFGGDGSVIVFVDSSGILMPSSAYLLNKSTGVRPVLNLKPEALKYGDGTASNPYRLTESLDNSSSSESGGIDTGD
ncbi:unknown [Mycoplasma sp. CAG:956]|nr:unknown [Mycoplasma sp. CAG:956]